MLAVQEAILSLTPARTALAMYLEGPAGGGQPLIRETTTGTRSASYPEHFSQLSLPALRVHPQAGMS